MTFKLDFAGNMCRAAFAILAMFLSELQNKAHLNQIRFQLCRVKSPTLIINGERIVLWQLKHWAGLSGSSLVRGMSTILSLSLIWVFDLQ